MNLPGLQDLNLKNKNVLLRLDLDVTLRPAQGKLVVEDDTRLREAVPTIKYLQENGAGKITVIGHRGRPDNSTSTSTNLSLEPVGKALEKILKLDGFKVIDTSFLEFGINKFFTITDCDLRNKAVDFLVKNNLASYFFEVMGNDVHTSKVEKIKIPGEEEKEEAAEEKKQGLFGKLKNKLGKKEESKE